MTVSDPEVTGGGNGQGLTVTLSCQHKRVSCSHARIKSTVETTIAIPGKVYIRKVCKMYSLVYEYK